MLTSKDQVLFAVALDQKWAILNIELREFFSTDNADRIDGTRGLAALMDSQA